MFVDTHAHLNIKDYDQDRESVIRRACETGVDWILDIGTDLKSSKKGVCMAEQFEMVYVAAGIHPHDASKVKDSDFDEFEQLFSHPKVKAIGEIGLDYHYNFSPRSIQKEIFLKQLNTALSYKKPVVIHVRESMEDALNIIHSFSAKKWEGVFHCFGGSMEDVSEVLNLGFCISFTGVVTFPNFKKSDMIKRIPLNRLLIETDSPYMTPVPHRGKRNEPSFIKYTALKLSDIMGVTVEELSDQTTQNAERLFRVGK